MARWISIVAVLVAAVAGFDTSNSTANEPPSPIEAIVAHPDWRAPEPATGAVWWIPQVTSSAVELDGPETTRTRW